MQITIARMDISPGRNREIPGSDSAQRLPASVPVELVRFKQKRGPSQVSQKHSQQLVNQGRVKVLRLGDFSWALLEADELRRVGGTLHVRRLTEVSGSLTSRKSYELPNQTFSCIRTEGKMSGLEGENLGEGIKVGGLIST